MAIPFLNHLDLRSVSELQNAILHKTTSGSATDIEGKIIYDTGTDTIKYYSGSSGSGSWISLTGDTNTFRTVQVDGGAIGATETLNLIPGTNITLDESDGSVTINAGASTTVGKTNSTQRSGSIELIAGSNVTITEDGTTGHFTFAASDTNTDTLQNITNDTTNADRFVTFVTSATGAQTGKSQANFKFNPNSGTLYVPNIVVSGTQTISNETVQVVENNTILFEGATADDYEIKLTVADPTADRVATIPNASGTVNLGYSTTIGDGSATSYNIDHNLNSRNVIVQFFDSSSYETVHADAVRSTVDRVVATFASAPASGDITVLVTRVA